MPEPQAVRPEGVLARIVRTKEVEVEALRSRADVLRSAARSAPPPKDFTAALIAPEVRVIAEVKRRSPGAGEIRPALDPAELAREYAAHGAAALSVLTDRDYFGGSLDDLRAVRRAVSLPILRKDFMIDPVQLHEARASGADCILLIVRILDDDRLAELHGLAEELGLSALVEVHDAAELERARAVGARLVGINNRDLSTFTTDLAVSERLRGTLPPGAVAVSESGIRSGEEVARLGRSGIHAVLVGETLLRAERPGEILTRLAGHPRSDR